MGNEKTALSYSELRDKHCEHAGHRFDTAVAVSPDGKRIWHAEFVVVYKKGEQGLVFCHHPGILFHSNKIMLGSCKVIRRAGVDAESRKRRMEKYVLSPDAMRNWLYASAPKSQVALYIGKLSVLIVEVGAVPDAVKPALALVSDLASSMYKGSIDNELAHRIQPFNRRSCGPGRICYCAPFEDK